MGYAGHSGLNLRRFARCVALRRAARRVHVLSGRQCGRDGGCHAVVQKVTHERCTADVPPRFAGVWDGGGLGAEHGGGCCRMRGAIHTPAPMFTYTFIHALEPRVYWHGHGFLLCPLPI